MWQAAGPGRDALKPCSLHLLFSGPQGMIFEKLRIWSMPQFVRFVHDLQPLRKDPGVVVKDLQFGTVPAKLYQPTVSSRSLRPGILFFHGGGTIFGSLSKSPSLSPGPECASLGAAWVGTHLPV